MVNSDTEMLFPLRAIPALADLRGPSWQDLVDKLSAENCDVNQRIAFTALMVKLAGCTSCNADSFRAMRGCTQCARQIIKRYKGNDAELIKNYQDCLKEVASYLQKRDQ